jgi:hypothetical protein
VKSAIRILAFSDDGASISPKLIWATPSHLEVVFKDDPKVLYYQVVKTSGIDITVRNLSIGTTDVNQSYFPHISDTISREFPGRFSAGEGLLGIGEVFLG